MVEPITIRLGAAGQSAGEPPQTAEPTIRQGWSTDTMLDARMKWNVDRIDDPIALADSDLVQSRVVQAIIAKLPGKVCIEGRAVDCLLKHVLGEISRDLAGSPAAALAAALRDGRTQASVARDLGIGCEYMCRKWKKVLLRLMRERITAMEQRSDQAA